MKKNPFSMHVDLDDFLPATDAEKAYMVQMRPSTTFFKDELDHYRSDYSDCNSTAFFLALPL